MQKVEITKKQVVLLGKQRVVYNYFWDGIKVAVRPRQDGQPHNYLGLIRVEGDIVGNLPIGYQTKDEAEQEAKAYSGRGCVEIVPVSGC